MRPLPALLGFVILLGAIVTAAASAAPAKPPRDGEAIYRDKCLYCHDARGWGTRALSRRTPPGEAMLTSRKVLPAALTKFVVRRGMGSMPGFTPTDLSNAEIDRVAAWLDKSGQTQ